MTTGGTARGTTDLSTLIEERVREAPDRTAVLTEGGRLSYGELDRRARRLAARLGAQGLRPGGVVAVCTVKLPDVLVGVLGALRAGGAYAVVAPHEPGREVRARLDLVKAAAVVTHAVHLPRVDERGADGGGRPTLCLEDVEDGAAGDGDDGGGPAAPRRAAAAAVLVTAGAAGKPRAVTLSHARLTAAYRSWAEVYGLDDRDRVLVTAAPDTAAFTGGWIRTLGAGATLVASWRAAGAEGCTVLDTDPLEAARALERPRRGLRLVSVGGERLGLAEQARLQGLLAPGARVLNVYGTAEVAGCGTWFGTDQLAGPVEAPERVSYVGRPFPGCGAQLRKGQIWLTPPEGGDPVPTGDFGRETPAGAAGAAGPLEFRGRRADRVNLGGRTVDTYRVESALASVPGVREAVVTEADGELVAYVVPRQGGGGRTGTGVAELRKLLTGLVPSADVPERVVTVASLPRDRAGKVTRSALPRPARERAPGSGRASGGGKGAGGDLPPEVAQWALVPVVATVLAAFLTGVFWPGSTDVSAVPAPWAGLFRMLYVAEWLAFGAGTAFLLSGYPLMRRQGKPRGLTVAAHLAVVWLLVSWWPQDNSYRLAAKDDWGRQAALVYVFNVPLMLAGVVVAVWASYRPRER
ncbi:AMP-binding protein [Streptomyces sp. NPDC050504]|uniref:AMP-binding protein n=1 Tax=Streptomyces sp. NPDC050504 TaxID=3365618 RepID=UPI00379E39EE